MFMFFSAESATNSCFVSCCLMFYNNSDERTIDRKYSSSNYVDPSDGVRHVSPWYWMSLHSWIIFHATLFYFYSFFASILSFHRIHLLSFLLDFRWINCTFSLCVGLTSYLLFPLLTHLMYGCTSNTKIRPLFHDKKIELQLELRRRYPEYSSPSAASSSSPPVMTDLVVQCWCSAYGAHQTIESRRATLQFACKYFVITCFLKIPFFMVFLFPSSLASFPNSFIHSTPRLSYPVSLGLLVASYFQSYAHKREGNFLFDSHRLNHSFIHSFDWLSSSRVWSTLI